MSGAILGMRRAEIHRKFDEIVDFAEVEQFLDTPVKRYSSGMHVRLAFAVAAHLEPEILFVDEVLAVGDAAFQRKCLGKMGDVARKGRTVLFVSHNMAIVDGLCPRCVSSSEAASPPTERAAAVVRRYLEAAEELGDGDVSLVAHEHRIPGMSPYLTRIRLLSAAGHVSTTFAQSEPIVIELIYDASACSVPLAGAGFDIVAASGARVGGFNNYMAVEPPYHIPQRGTVRFRVPQSPHLLQVRSGYRRPLEPIRVLSSTRSSTQSNTAWCSGHVRDGAPPHAGRRCRRASLRVRGRLGARGSCGLRVGWGSRMTHPLL